MLPNNPGAIWQRLQDGVLVVAEIGKNFIQTEDERSVSEHLANAIELVDAAADAGAEAVKFQTHTVEDEQLNATIKAPHFSGADRYSWVTRNTKATPLDDFWLPLKQHCDERGVVFFSTPMSRGAAQVLNQVGVNLWKIASCDVLDFALLDYVRESSAPIIISSGMSTLEEVERAVAFLREKSERVALLHCVSRYPCPPEDLSLGSIEFLRDKFDIPVGFSDHSVGDPTPDLVAVAMGATIVEKHFSLSRDLWGSDHKVSMTPDELADLVSKVKELISSSDRQTAIMRTDFARRAAVFSGKTLQEGEKAFRPVFGKSLIASREIPVGTVITPDMVSAMRPREFTQEALSSDRYPEVLGKTTTRALNIHEPIMEDSLV